MKPKASYYTTQLKNLTNEVYMLQSRLLELKEEHTTLQVQQHILASVCDALNWLRGGHAQAAVHRRWLAPGAKAGAPSEAELALLHQLGTITDSPLEQQLQQLQLQHSSSEGTKSSHQSLHTEQHTADTTDATQSQQQSPEASAQFNALSPRIHVAAGGSPQAPAYPAAAPPEPGAEAPAMQPTYLTDPPGHYLGMMWHTLSRAPDPRARSMTLQDFAQYWAGLVKELSLCLTLTEQQGPQYAMQQDICAGMQHPLQALQDHLLKHLGLVTALVLQNRVDLVHPLRLINLSSLELSDTPEQTWERVLWLTERLQLREDQQLAITAGCDIFKRLLEQVLAERQMLLAQQAAQTGVRLPNGRNADLETEQHMAKQLQVLARKEQFLVACAALFMGCVLDVMQLAKAIVLVWPFVPHFHLIGPAVVKRKAAAAAAAQQQQPQHKRRGRGH